MNVPSFIPSIYRDDSPESQLPKSKLSLDSTITKYINREFEKFKPYYETFEHEDIKPDLSSSILELQEAIDNCVKKTGDIVSGQLCLLKAPQAKMDVVNKEYTDWLFSTLVEKIEGNHLKNCDLNMNHFKIKNVQTPTNLGDAVNKNYVDEKFEECCGVNKPQQYIFSKGQSMVKKTFFFNPGFICPRKMHITAVGFSTSPYKYKIGEKTKMGEFNPTKLYFMINNEIRSEYVVEKDIQLGHILKEFETPIILEKADNLMLVVESILEDASVNLMFY